MSKFRVGDRVRRIGCNWGSIYVGAEGTVSRCDDMGLSLKEFPNDPGGSPTYFELVKDVDPIEAVKLLTSLGYTVIEPPAKLTGEVVVYKFPSTNLGYTSSVEWHTHRHTTFHNATLIAVVNWTEGDGI